MALARSLLSVGLAAELGCGAGPPADGGGAAVGALDGGAAPMKSSEL